MRFHSFEKSLTSNLYEDFNPRVEVKGTNAVYYKTFDWVKEGGKKVIGFFKKYLPRTKDYLERTVHKVTPLEWPGLGGYHQLGSSEVVINSETPSYYPKFAENVSVHEDIHVVQDKSGYIKKLYNGLKRHGFMGYLLAMNIIEGITTYLVNKITGKKTHDAYEVKGLDKGAEEIEKSLGERYLVNLKNDDEAQLLVGPFLRGTNGVIYFL